MGEPKLREWGSTPCPRGNHGKSRWRETWRTGTQASQGAGLEFEQGLKPKFLTTMLHHRDLTKGHYSYLKNSIEFYRLNELNELNWMIYCKQTNESGKEKLLVRSKEGRRRNGTKKEFVTIIRYPVVTIYRILYFCLHHHFRANEENISFCLLSASIGMGQKFWDSKSLLSSDLRAVPCCSSMLNFR